MLFKKLIPISACLFLILGLAACGGNDEAQEVSTGVDEGSKIEESLGGAVAIVNGEEISEQQFVNQLEQVKMSYQQQGIEIDEENEVLIKNHVLDQLVNTTLIVQAATEEGFSPSNDEVQAELDQIRGQYDSDEEFNTILEQNNLDLTTFENEITYQLSINRYVADKIEEPLVSEVEIKERYDLYKQQTEEMPELEEIEAQLKEEIKNEKNQASIGELVERLRNESQIEILI
ncbi:SurA N-terminal domain-containing protein [Anaerobacillus isosaccharinicus]|uniref:SurA N-terminal domain-containing protein n=1 Tax=Anaerobacillus isosaccharinicus TaxID=1532552 RepID=A0A1S2LQC1_9BACI|nr:SurA N-terminal domain-containing protein [Anaerobacillus isosaccharinicus]MBA5586333.1 SurA N-terminal domain-containing protein [Anaerobacillus isosaccharinicus]QOY35417.1 SurA N-terminal domain-containing protein [Anaerobacillus isosaccharinicus]